MTGQEFVKRVFDIVGNEYEVLGEYKKSATKILLRHVKCGHEYLVTPNSFIRGSRCPPCMLKYCNENNKRRKSDEQFKKEVFEAVGDKYIFLDEYISAKTKIRVHHIKCGSVYLVAPSSFISRKGGCSKCSRKLNKNIGMFKKDVFEMVGMEYSVIGEFKTTADKILMQHNDCGNQWSITPSNFLYSGRRCPKCQFSRGEKTISNQLEYRNVIYEPQKRFKDCKNEAMLPFDFYIVLNESHLLVEYDGDYHFYSRRFGIESLIKTQTNDKIKNQYCIDNNIPLLRIPYWEQSNLESILDTALMHFGIIPEDDLYDYTLIKEWLVDKNWDHDAYIAKCPKNVDGLAKKKTTDKIEVKLD